MKDSVCFDTIKLADETIPVCRFGDKNDGPTLVVSAGLHGCEYIGVLAAKRLVKMLCGAILNGRVIVLPVLNASGFYAGAKQMFLPDNVNLNRIFPGTPTGGRAARFAHAIETELFPLADFWIDLHSGDVNEIAMPFVYYPGACADAVTDAAMRAAASLNVGYAVRSGAQNGLYSHAAMCKVPSLLLEWGGAGRYTPQQVDGCLEAVLRLMSHLSILKGDYKPVPQLNISEASYDEADADGFWYPFVREGERVAAGQVLGELRDIDDNLMYSYRARFDGVVLYYTLSLGVKKDDPLVACGRLGG